MFGANLEIPVEICEELSHRQTEFPRIKATKIILKVKVNDPHSQYQLRVSHDAYLVVLALICDELLCRQDKVYRRTDWQTDEWTSTGNNNIPLAGEGMG